MTALAACGLWVVHEKGFPKREKFRQLVPVFAQLKAGPAKNEAGIRYLRQETKPALIYSLYADQHAPDTVALVGDSHAHSAFYGVAELGRELGFNTLMTGWWVPNGHLWRPDRTWQRERIVTLLGEHTDIKKVFLIVRGPCYLAREPQRGQPGKTGLDLTAGSRPPTEFQVGLQAMVDDLRGLGKEVFIVAEIPELAIDIRHLIGRDLNGLTIRDDGPKTTREANRARQQAYLDMLHQIEGAPIIPTLDAFCPESVGGECRLFSDDGLPLYYDHTHLSQAGSLFQAQKILRPSLEK